MAENYIALEINNPKTKEIAETISNPTCKKILNALTEKEMSESDLSQELSIPLNTIGYNIKKLLDSSLIEKSKSFFWSVKGKKIPTYKLSNKKIIILPKYKTPGIITSIIISGLIALGIKAYSETKYAISQIAEVEKSFAAAPAGAPEQIAELQEPLISAAQAPEIWLWFLLGSLTAILIILILNQLKGGKQ